MSDCCGSHAKPQEITEVEREVSPQKSVLSRLLDSIVRRENVRVDESHKGKH